VPSRRAVPALKAIPSDIRVHNRSLLLQYLLSDGPMSKADLARASGLTPAAVAGVVADLAADRLVEVIGRQQRASAGKPATLVGVATDGPLMVCLDLSDDDMAIGALVSLTGKIVLRRELARRGEVGAKAVALVLRLAKQLIAASERPILGIGCGTPGIVDGDGVVLEAAHLQWHNQPIGARLRAATGIPTHVVNDANAAVLAEYSFGASGGPEMLLVRAGQGLGAGIMLGGRLFTGTNFAAGEIGHIQVSDPGTPCACGRTGCLEAEVGGALLEHRRLARGEAPTPDSASLAQAGRLVGLALAPIVSALNLSEIVISGHSDLLDDRFRIAARDTIRERTFPAIGDHVVVRFSSLGDDDILLGAAVWVLSNELGVFP
jgi:predicted NBD/HSP70 family sugar kinase